MAKKGKHEQHAGVQASAGAAWHEAGAGPAPKMKRKESEREMRLLHGELVAMQEWVKASGARICIVSRAGTLPARAARSGGSPSGSSPRVFRVVALPAPTEREELSDVRPRYLPHFPPPARS